MMTIIISPSFTRTLFKVTDGTPISRSAAESNLLVVHELVAGEGRDGLEEEVGGLAEVSDGHGVEAFVDLQPVPAIPVTALLHHGVGAIQIGSDELWKMKHCTIENNTR